ncbi:MAG: hypothetical protein K2N34_04335 [Lachnospiraceae bacterium]|nr:hypothetical protein [Lachnospiraceae bacterium]
MGLWRVMGVVGIGDSGIFAAGLGLWKGECGGRGMDRFCLTVAGVWIVFINGSRAAVSTTAALLQTANFALLA